MSEEHSTLRIRFPRAPLVVLGLGAGIVLLGLLLLVSAHSAGAAPLPALGTGSPLGAVPSTLGDVTSSVPLGSLNSLSNPPVSAVLPTVGATASAAMTTVSSQVSGLENGGAAVTQSLAGPIGAVPAVPISALPVLSPLAPVAAPWEVVFQGPRTTATSSSRSVSATTLDVVRRTGSAGSLSGRTPLLAGSGLSWPPTPRHPFAPENPLAAMGTTSGSSVNGSSLDSVPPAILVLALLVAAGIGRERRRRPKIRFDLRFAPPG